MTNHSPIRKHPSAGIVWQEKVFFLIFVNAVFTFTLAGLRYSAHTGHPMHPKLKSFVMLLIWPAAACAAAPTHMVYAQLNALAVNYHVESNEINSNLYATNHEDFPVACDASMSTNKQEDTRGKEIRIEPHNTHVFSFKHRRSITHIKLYLVCEAIPEAGTAEKKPADHKKSFQAGEMLPKDHADPVVPVEDLGTSQ